MPSIVSTNPDITRIILTMGFENVYIIVNEPASCDQDLVELEAKEIDEAELRENVLNAHKVLMDLNENNREQFKDLVATLEGEVDEHTSYVG